MLIGLFLIAFLTMWGIAFVLFERDLTCPTMLLISGYTICVGTAAVSYFSFPFTYHAQTLFVMILGTVFFLIPAYAIKEIAAGKEEKSMPAVARSVIVFKPWALVLSAVLLLALIALTLLTYVRVLQQFDSAVTYASAIPMMRKFLFTHPEATTLKELFILSQVKKIFLVGGWFLLYSYAHNCAVRRSFLVDKGVLVNLFLVLCLIATAGGRGELVAFLVGGLGLYSFFNYLYNRARIRISLKLILKTVGGGITAAVVFFALLYLTGRRSGGFDMRALWTHVQIYLAGPVPLLNHFLQAPLSGGGDIFGQETFYAINSQLTKLGLLDIPLYSPHLEYRPGVYLDDVNCYTAYRSYLYDFGYAGLVFCPILFSVLINGLYYACVRWAKKSVFVPSLMLYATAMFLIFIDFERSCFFTYWLGFGVLVYLAGFMLLHFFLLKTGLMRVVPLKAQGGLIP